MGVIYLSCVRKILSILLLAVSGLLIVSPLLALGVEADASLPGMLPKAWEACLRDDEDEPRSDRPA